MGGVGQRLAPSGTDRPPANRPPTDERPLSARTLTRESRLAAVPEKESACEEGGDDMVLV